MEFSKCKHNDVKVAKPQKGLETRPAGLEWRERLHQVVIKRLSQKHQKTKEIDAAAREYWANCSYLSKVLSTFKKLDLKWIRTSPQKPQGNQFKWKNRNKNEKRTKVVEAKNKGTEENGCFWRNGYDKMVNLTPKLSRSTKEDSKRRSSVNEDIETNPGPINKKSCENCREFIRQGAYAFECNLCKKIFHASCNGRSRWDNDKTRANNKTWKCDGCEGKITQDRREVERNVRTNTQENCVECRRKLYKAKYIPRCKTCKKKAHGTCSKMTRSQMNKEIERSNWECSHCRKKEDGKRKKGTDVINSNSGTLVKSKKEHLTIIQWNADGINNKRGELQRLMEEEDADIVAIQETKLKEKQELQWKGYTIYREDRKVIRNDPNKPAGGVMFLIKNEIPFRKIEEWRGGVTEGQTIKVDINKENSIRICNVYRPPIRNSHNDRRINEEIKDWINEDNDLILGDFNLHSPVWSSIEAEDEEAKILIDWCEEQDYLILNDGSATRMNRTQGTKSSPDITIAKNNIAEKCEWNVRKKLSSDHLPIVIKIKDKRQIREKIKLRKWNYGKADWEKFRTELNNHVREPFGKMSMEIERLNKTIIEAAKKHIPTKQCYRDSKIKCSDRVKELEKERDKKREDEDMEEWKKLDNLIKEEERIYRKETWKRFVEELDESTETSKVWNMIKTLKGDKKEQKENEILVIDKKEYSSDKKKAEAFILQYQTISKGKEDKEDKALLLKMKKKVRRYQEKEEYGIPFNIYELEMAIDQVEEKRKGGTDGIEPAMVKNMGTTMKQWLLDIYNESWKTGEVPGLWKKAEIIPILKPGKDPSKPDSYRPVSLTQVFAKVMERMVAERMNYWMENKGIINNWQTGFQRGKSCEDQIIRLTQSTQDGFEAREKTLMVALDCSKAYDRVKKGRLWQRMIEEKMPGPMIRWFKSFTEGRIARTRVGTEHSKWRPFRDGVPQGAVTSPLMFLIYVNQWNEFKHQEVEYCGFADDLALWTRGKEIAEMEEKIQNALNKVELWTKKNNLLMNASKTECILFSLDNKDKMYKTNLSLNGVKLQAKENIRLLGVQMDHKLTFKEHVKNVISKMKRRTNILRAIAGKDWGWNPNSLVKIYRTMVESIVWFCVAGWFPWISKTNIKKIEATQREALRIITGHTKTTKDSHVYLESNINPISTEAKRKTIIAYEKSKRMPEENPRRKVMDYEVRRRLKRNRGMREQAKEWISNNLGEQIREEFRMKRRKVWKNYKDKIEIYDQTIKECNKQEDKDKAKEIANRTILTRGENLSKIYTDGSAKDGTENGGYAAVSNDETRIGPAGKWTSSYRAEVCAMREALNMTKGSTNNTMIITDSQSLVRSLMTKKHSKDKILEECKETLEEVGKDRKIIIQWIPSHVGVEGNEKADEEAKNGSNMNQDGVEIEFNVIKRRIVRKIKYTPEINERDKKIFNGKRKKSSHNTRRDEVILNQLRAGHCNKTRYYRKRIGTEEDGNCSDCGIQEDKDHVFYCDKWRNDREQDGVEMLNDDEATLKYLKKVKKHWFQ